MFKKIISIFLLGLFIMTASVFAQTEEEELPQPPTYLQPVIATDKALEVQKSTIFDASLSFLPHPDSEIKYEWNFGDGNRNEGVEVLHAYKEPGTYTITLTIDDGYNIATTELEVFVYRKLIVLITDQTAVQERIEVIKDFAEKQGVYIKLIESFGSSTEFISEEVLTKKLTEESVSLQKANQIIIWTKENAGLNALSRHIQGNRKKITTNFSQKTITVLESNVTRNLNRIQRQFKVIKPKSIVVAKEAAIYPIIESRDEEEFINTLKKGGYEYKIITEKTGKLRPWNFMSYFVNLLINNGIPDNIIALLLLLPIIATVVAFMKQFVGVTTFGIYTPSIITLSFLVIGMHAGLLTLSAAIIIGGLVRSLLRKVRMLFIPRMAVVITIVSLALFLIIIASVYLGLFNAEFLSIAIFPMLILTTLVEKFVSVKTEKGLSSASTLMLSTVFVAIIAYFIAGGEIDLGFVSFKLEYIKNLIMAYPEIVLLLIIINILLGKWSGLRILERIRFREVLRHIEE
ncbi:PKD domain-containing protein [Candidatus Peregrinibacteria bacterium]|nr:PKD domain-containing protein [Candidatus Peregrinibacteria bacterium]